MANIQDLLRVFHELEMVGQGNDSSLYLLEWSA
jgi:hypothetical protein